MLNKIWNTALIPIPDNVPEHIDDPMLNTNVEDGILALVYETKDQTFTIWTSQEAIDTQIQPQ